MIHCTFGYHETNCFVLLNEKIFGKFDLCTFIWNRASALCSRRVKLKISTDRRVSIESWYQSVSFHVECANSHVGNRRSYYTEWNRFLLLYDTLNNHCWYVRTAWTRCVKSRLNSFWTRRFRTRFFFVITEPFSRRFFIPSHSRPQFGTKCHFIASESKISTR